MAQITSSNDIQVLKIRQFLGLNENPDGDTKIKNGEMSKMRNFRITREKHLQLRPGTKTVLNLKTAWDAWCAESGHTAPTANPVFSGAWEGVVDSKQRTLAAFGGLIFSLDPAAATTKVVGQCTQDQTSFFGFSNKVYLLNGHEYMSWDGKDNSSFVAVEGYIPTVMNATTPAGGGFLLENVNRLTGKRKVLYSPDGKEEVFHIPEKTVDEIISVKIGDTAQTYTSDLTARTFTITPAPAAGTNTLELIYRSGLLHDIGKPETLTVDEDGTTHFHGHPAVGEELARRILRRLRFDNDTVAVVTRLVRYHDYGNDVTPDLRIVRRAVNKIGEDIFPLLFPVKQADILAQSDYLRAEKLENLELWKQLYEEMLEKKQCVSLKTLAVTGRDLIAMGMKPGRELGDMLQKLLELVLEHPEQNTREQLLEKAGELAAGKE